MFSLVLHIKFSINFKDILPLPLFFHRITPESLHWLTATKRTNRTGEWIKKQQRLNRRTIDLREMQKDDTGNDESVKSSAEGIKSKTPTRSIIDIFRSKARLVCMRVEYIH
jgi:hypothetical protein